MKALCAGTPLYEHCINLRKGELNDPQGLARDISVTGHHGNGDYQIQISTDDDLEYVLSLIKQAYKKQKP